MNTENKTKEIRNVRDTTFDLLRKLGMTTVFGNPGSTELAFLEKWPKDFRYILALQEASAVSMADGYARLTGNAPFVNVQSAAGLGHALGNIMAAFKNQTPMVIMAGQQARSLLIHQDAYLAADRATEFPYPYVKWSCEPARAQDVPAAIQRAYYVAMQPPYGPTFVSIPSDDWSIPVSCTLAEHKISRQGPADSEALAQFAAALKRSRNPVIVAGSELGIYGGYDALVTLAERIQAPVWTAPVSWNGCFPENHPLFAGFLPAIPERINKTLANHDLIFVVGAPIFSFHVDGEFPLAHEHNSRIFQLTVDAGLAARSMCNQSLVGDLSSSLKFLISHLPTETHSAPQQPQRVPPERIAATPLMSTAYVLQQLRECLPENALIVEEAPSARPDIQRQLPIDKDKSFFTMASGGLGYGLPAAVGFALADPARKVIGIIGDGSMMYSVQALWSAVQENVPVTIIVLNNCRYGAMYSFSKLLGYQDAPGLDLPGIDFVKLAQGLGVKAWRAESPDELQHILRPALSSTSPSLVEIIVDPQQGDVY